MPAGTRLFRAARSVCEYAGPLGALAREDSDTGKTGLYFGTYLGVSLAMALEQGLPLQLAEFRVTRDLLVPYDKYGFRALTPALYFDAQGNFIPNVPTPASSNISHLDNTAFPLGADKETLVLRDEQMQWLEVHGYGELFLSMLSGDLGAVEFVRAWDIQNGVADGLGDAGPDELVSDTAWWEARGVLVPRECMRGGCAVA